jgi:hypothetical protein
MEFDEIYLRAGFTIPPLTLNLGFLSVLCGNFFRLFLGQLMGRRGQIALGELVTVEIGLGFLAIRVGGQDSLEFGAMVEKAQVDRLMKEDIVLNIGWGKPKAV